MPSPLDFVLRSRDNVACDSICIEIAMVKPVSDLHQTEEAVWRRVKTRELVVRRLAEFPRVPDAEIGAAMAELGASRA